MQLLRRRRRSETQNSTVVRRSLGRQALVVALHGYGSDEGQFDTLLPLRFDAEIVVPRAPSVVPPGFGWWLPVSTPAGLELAHDAAVANAVANVVATLDAEQRRTGIGPERTILVGYSQGAVLALTLAARHPETIAGLVTGAGALLPNEVPEGSDRVLDILVMNGSLDPVWSADDHERTVHDLRSAGHRVVHRHDPVPHVIDSQQAAAAQSRIARWIAGFGPR